MNTPQSGSRGVKRRHEDSDTPKKEDEPEDNIR